jgi:hypothetical protein
MQHEVTRATELDKKDTAASSWRPVVIIQHASSDAALRNSAFFPYRLFVCFVCFSNKDRLHNTTNFDFFSASEKKYVFLYRFWDAELENGHEKSCLATV